MSKRKRGMSLEEKRTALLSIYLSSKDVLNLKEIEKKGAKKGVVMQTIKDVNQALVDDSLVDTDKIGSGNFYWAFKSKRLRVERTKAEKSTEQIANFTTQLQSVKVQMASAQEGREPSPEREAQLKKLQALREKKAALQQRLECLKANDPAQLEELRKGITAVKEGCNRWIDNIWNLKRYVIDKFNLEAVVFDKQIDLGAPIDDFDYLE